MGHLSTYRLWMWNLPLLRVQCLPPFINKGHALMWSFWLLRYHITQACFDKCNIKLVMSRDSKSGVKSRHLLRYSISSYIPLHIVSTTTQCKIRWKWKIRCESETVQLAVILFHHQSSWKWSFITPCPWDMIGYMIDIQYSKPLCNTVYRCLKYHL